jgi:DNA-binding beta-propeller fold protein YncE
MVQSLLRATARRARTQEIAITLVIAALLVPLPVAAASKQKPAEITVPEIVIEGGRKLDFERILSTDHDIRGKKGFWTKVVDFVAGEPDLHYMVRPYSVAVDSRGRVIVSDPGAQGVHVFDPEQHKYKFVDRRDKDKDKDFIRQPQCVAVDAHDNFYVTDSQTGKVYVFNADAKYQRALGSLKGGEGYFKRPTGIAVDSDAQRIYVTDTLRDKIFVLDMQGQVVGTIGKPGSGDGEFHYPTELRILGDELIVVDAMNFRIQILGKDGSFHAAIGQLGDTPGLMFRPKGVSVDSEGHLYVVDAASAKVQIFDRQGQFLYWFGGFGTGPEQFQLPAGIFIDKNDRIFVVDSFNGRVQVLHYYGLPRRAGGQP